MGVEELKYFVAVGISISAVPVWVFGVEVTGEDCWDVVGGEVYNILGIKGVTWGIIYGCYVNDSGLGGDGDKGFFQGGCGLGWDVVVNDGFYENGCAAACSLESVVAVKRVGGDFRVVRGSEVGFIDEHDVDIVDVDEVLKFLEFGAKGVCVPKGKGEVLWINGVSHYAKVRERSA